MFVTVNELVGVPGLPTTQQGLRYSLKKVQATPLNWFASVLAAKHSSTTSTAFLNRRVK